MIQLVIDTNVIISAALSPNGNPAKILSLISIENEIHVFFNMKILIEYKEVLSRPKMSISQDMQIRIVNAIIRMGSVFEPITSTISLPDETDRIFYDTAKESNSILITGNTKHYPAEPFIMTPIDFLIELNREN